MNISAMQGYTPQLDELNHSRPMNTFISESPIYMMNKYRHNNHRAPKKKNDMVGLITIYVIKNDKKEK
jgi:hypothetical protein